MTETTWHQRALEIPKADTPERAGPGSRPLPAGTCATCGEHQGIYALGQCQPCYDRDRHIRKKAGIPTPPRNFTCVDCGTVEKAPKLVGKVPERCSVCGPIRTRENLRTAERARYAVARAARLAEIEPIPEGTKRCSKCGEVKPFEDYTLEKATGKPIHACKPCLNAAARRKRQEATPEERQADRDYHREATAKYRTTDLYRETLAAYRKTDSYKASGSAVARRWADKRKANEPSDLPESKLCPGCSEEKPTCGFIKVYGWPGSRCKDCTNAKLQGWRESDAGRNSTYLSKYGVTLEWFETTIAAQDGRCAICRNDKPGGAGDWHIDHDHQSGRPRGLLCQMCNHGLGFVRDDPDRVRALIGYLSAVRPVAA